MGQLDWRCAQLYEVVDSSSLFTPAKRKAVSAAMHTDMHRAGYVLDPAFLSHDTLADETVADSFYNVVEKLIPEADARGPFRNELEKYRQQQGIFARSIAQDAIKTTPAHVWWNSYGATTPLLQKLAIKVLSRGVSACACERNWSTYDFIHSKRRNLRPGRANDLVYVFSNLRLAKRIQDLDYQEVVLDWSDSEEEEEEDSKPQPLLCYLSVLYILFALYAVVVPNTLKTDKFDINVFLATILPLFCQYF